jgi:hypothetical protein
MKNRKKTSIFSASLFLITGALVLLFCAGVSADVLYFQVDSPTSSSVWNPGNTYTIHWYTKDTSGVNFPWVWVKLLLYPQGQLNKATVIGEFPINTDSTDLGWKVPPNTPAGKYVIRVQSRDEMVTYTDQYGKVLYIKTFADSAPFSINPPVSKVVLPGQTGWVPPNSDMFGSPITPASGSPSGTEKKKDIGGAKKYSASAAQKSGLAIPNVSGQWKSSIGLYYNITQKGNQFEWTVTKSNEKGQGNLKGNEVSVSWSGPQGSGSSIGQITAVDATGKATQIDWKNGVRFYR